MKGISSMWPSGPQDQTTPRAAPTSSRAEEANPFDSLQQSQASSSSSSAAAAQAHRKSTSGNSMLALGVPRTAAGDMTPSGLLTPGGNIATQSAIPTTSISTQAPDFTMKLPPAKQRLDASSSSSSASPTRNTAAPRGHLTVKVIEARNLAVSSASGSAPYAVISFDKNEFIGREPIDPSMADAMGEPVPRPEGAEAGNRTRARTITPASTAEEANTAASSSSSLNAHNPVWKHQVTFDVTQEKQPVYVSVYDRLAEEEGFLGMRVITPRFIHKMSSDQWYPLLDRDDAEAGEPSHSAGEIRVQVSYERLPAKKLTPADFEYLKLIGRGTFGRVFQVRKKDTRRIYAMKVLSKREIAQKKEVTHTMGERKILEKSLDCPFLVGLKFSFQSEQELYFVTDYKSGGELFWHLQREGRFTEERARFYIAELVIALGHLHKYDIVYRDLKPENILLDATGHVALCDFGLSKPDLGAGQLTNTFCGTTEYLAPEVLLDESGYSKLVDFWSLGVLLFEMCCGWSPFYAEDTQQMYRNICFGKIKFPRGAIGDDGKQFVKGLLNRNPKHRLGAGRDAQDLMEHPFFKDIDFEALARKQLTPPFKPLVESDESVANFDPEFTETDLAEVAMLGGGDEGLAQAIENGTLLPGSVDAANEGSGSSGSGSAAAGGSSKAASTAGGASGVAGATSAKGKNGVAINKANGNSAEDDALSSSIQDKFRGFSYSGDYDGSVAGSLASSFGGRRGSGGFGLGGAALGMSKMAVRDAEEGQEDAGGDAEGDEVMRSPTTGRGKSQQ
ncbi:kinase-like protein [Jaminaea rosea]|uniref:Kinase-like protein n=1 Tax=Jaminaea rosea TaxID=1569628 RepID=A0A316URX3_9BASI|nr:kinase-like protein [Jaminaea rosea]PWN27071.1 kinase-like protein [Jaminaea rosea]